MKNGLYIASLVILAVVAGIGLSGCDKEEASQKDQGSLTITTQDNMPVDAKGGSYTIEYTLSDGAAGPVSASVPSGVAWVKDFDTAAQGKVTFTVDANYSGIERSAVVTVSCGEGNSDALTIVQPTMTDVPSIRIVSANGADLEEYETDADYSDTESVKYEISNPVQGASVSASSDQFWVEIDDELSFQDGMIVLVIGANSDAAERKAIVTVTYSFDGGSVYDQFTVIQAGKPVEPALVINGKSAEGTYTAGAESGDGTGSQEVNLNYELSVNGTSGDVEFTLEDADGGVPTWISASDASQATPDIHSSDFVYLLIQDNPSTEERSAVLTVTYKYGNKSVSDKVTVVQEGKEETAVSGYEFEADKCTKTDSFGLDENVTCYYFDFSKEGSSTVYSFCLYSNSSEPTGEYAFNDSNELHTFDSFSFVSIDGTSIDFASGSIKITSGSNGYDFEADMVDVNGDSHHVTYSGAIAF